MEINGSKHEDLIFPDIVRPELYLTSSAANLAFNEEVKTMIKNGRNVAHFAFGQSPFPIPRCFIEELQNFAHVNSYLPVQGIHELRESLSEFHKLYEDITLDPQNLIIAPGSKELICLIMNVFNGTLFLPSPTWTTYAPQAHLVGKHPLLLPTDQDSGWKVTPSVLRKALEYMNPLSRKGNKLLILTNPGNPTGTSYTESELMDLSDCCRENKIFVLSDEIYARLTFGYKHCSMIKYYPEGTIMTSGFSKWASAGGWRLGYAYVPTPLHDILVAITSSASHTYSCAPAPMQYAVAKALKERSNELKEYMDDCTHILKLVANYCYSELASVGVTGHQSEAGYYFMPNFEVIRNGLRKRGIFNGVQMTRAILEEADVALMGAEFFMRPCPELSVRFCFVCFDGNQALEAFKDLKESGTIPQPFSKEGNQFLMINCRNVVEGVQRLKEWVQRHLGD